MSNLTVTLPTPLTDELKQGIRAREQLRCFNMPEDLRDALYLCAQLERDVLTLAMRLYGESPDTMSPETIEVMRRWSPRCSAILIGETV